ncbi:hypothetical protein, partial [Columbia Basin potato purple top phytoplasma]
MHELIIIKDLGEIEESNEKNIIARIRRLNPQLNQIDLTVESKTSANAAFIKSKEHPGRALVNYTIKKTSSSNNHPNKHTSSSSKITDLNELIIIKDLGEIEESNEKNIIARIRR